MVISLEGTIKKQSLKHQKGGFTLIETIFVIGVLAIILTGTFTIIKDLITLNKRIAYRSVAYQTMDTKLEEIRAKNFNELSDGTVTTQHVTGLPYNSSLVVTTSPNVEGVPQTGIKEVTVAINWNFKGAQNVRTSTYITQGGIKK